MGDLRGQIVLKKAARVVRVGKGGFEKLVVWVMDGVLRHVLFRRVAGGGGDRRRELAEEGRAQD